MCRTDPTMPLFVPILAAVWLLVILVALLLCVAARRLDDELTRGELAPVIDIAGARLSGRHVA
jgi:uncharacterized membrane protein